MDNKNKNKFKIIFILFFGIVLIGTTGFHFLLKLDFLHSLYLTIVTLTTVGYGDISPYTRAQEIGLSVHSAEIFTIMLILLGMGILAYSISSFTEYVLSGDYAKYRRAIVIERQIVKLKNHYIVCGINEMSRNILIELLKTERKFVVVEEELEIIDEFLHKYPGILFINGDPTDEETLVAAGINRSQGVMLTLMDEKDNLMVSMTIRARFEKLKLKRPKILARVIDEEKVGPRFTETGTNSVISTSFIGGRRMCSEMLRPSVTTVLDRMLMDASKDIRVEEFSMAGETDKIMSIRELSYLGGGGIQILALKRRGELYVNPASDFKINGKDTLIVLGEMKKIIKYRRKFEGS